MEKITGPRIDVQVDQAKLAEVEKTLTYINGGLRMAVVSAINRSLRSARSHVAGQIRGEIRLGKRQIARRILVRKASGGNWWGVMGLGDMPFSLARDFKAVDLRTRKRGLRSGVRVGVRPGASDVLPRAFMAKTWGAENVVMRKYRSGERPEYDWMTGQLTGSGQLVGRMPIVKMRGPILRDIWTRSPQLVHEAAAWAGQVLGRELDGQVARLIKQNPIAT
jgi:hypothetical protein